MITVEPMIAEHPAQAVEDCDGWTVKTSNGSLSAKTLGLEASIRIFDEMSDYGNIFIVVGESDKGIVAALPYPAHTGQITEEFRPLPIPIM